MTRDEIIAKMASGQISGHSKLNMRSEEKQKRFSSNKIPKLQKKVKMKKKLLLFTELAIPFNPDTGVEDENYNAVCKFRPPLSSTSTALYLKSIAAKNETVKNTFMTRSGISEWDVSDLDTLTDTDKKIFGKYRVPRIFTIPVVKVNIPKMTGRNYAKEYAVSIQRGPSGEIIGETPMILKINKLFRDICYEELSEFSAKIESGEINMSDQQQKEYKANVRSKIAVSDEMPSNYALLVELPLTNSYQISADIDINGVTKDSIADHVRYAVYTKSLSSCVNSYTSGDFAMFDTHFDYFEMDMTCPSDVDEHDYMRIGLDTKIDSPKIKLQEQVSPEALNKLDAAISEYADSDPDIEATVRRSTYVSDYDDEVANQILSSLYTVLDINDNPFVTKKVITSNQEVLSLAYPEAIAEILEEIDANVSDKAEGVLDEGASTAEAKQYDLSSSEFAADDNDEDISSSLNLSTFSLS